MEMCLCTHQVSWSAWRSTRNKPITTQIIEYTKGAGRGLLLHRCRANTNYCAPAKVWLDWDILCLFSNFSKSYYFCLAALEQLGKLHQLILVNLNTKVILPMHTADCAITSELQIENKMTVQRMHQFPFIRSFPSICNFSDSILLPEAHETHRFKCVWLFVFFHFYCHPENMAKIWLKSSCRPTEEADVQKSLSVTCRVKPYMACTVYGYT